MHPTGAEPSGTLEWLRPRPLLARHHHIRLSHPKDVARVARWMAGKAVGLVLSGGGSRGLAHLGVLHALDDAGVPIDVIGGTSQVPALAPPSLRRPVPRSFFEALAEAHSMCRASSSHIHAAEALQVHWHVCFLSLLLHVRISPLDTLSTVKHQMSQ